MIQRLKDGCGSISQGSGGFFLYSTDCASTNFYLFFLLFELFKILRLNRKQHLFWQSKFINLTFDRRFCCKWQCAGFCAGRDNRITYGELNLPNKKIKINK